MKTILRVIDSSKATIPEGEIFLNDEDILKMKNNEIQRVRRENISMISQEPTAALNPVFTVGQQIMDIIKFSNPSKSLSNKMCIRDSL